MQWLPIADFDQHIGTEVEVRGWMYNRRSSGKIHFLQIRDGTGVVQGIMEKAVVGDDLFEEAKRLRIESSLILHGTIRADERSPTGVEMDVHDLQIVHNPQEDYPIGKKEHGIDFLMDYRHLWVRSSKQFHILRIRHEIIKAIREFYNDRGFILVDTPIFTGSIGEGASGLFELDYFDYGKAYLTQTGQLYLEAACMSLGKVYNLGPTFRAEKSKTRRHLTEFWMNEAEVAYYDTHDNMRLQEELVSFVVLKVLERCGNELHAIERDASKLQNVCPPFGRISYDEAIKLLQKKGFDIQWGMDFGGDEETAISDEFDRPVMVFNYPGSIKAFYMQPDEQRPEVVLCNDMLAPEGYGEIIGASQRIHDHDLMVEMIRKHQLPLESYQWYLDIRKYGTVPHSGYGLGVERTVAWICGLKHIREAIPFARTLYRIQP